MPDKDPSTVSRRVLIGAASATPLLAGGAPVSPSTDLTARCEEWLALDAEINRLSSRWAHLETVLVKQKDWLKMTPNQREALPPTEEMHAIDVQLGGLYEKRQKWLDALHTHIAHDMQGVTRKLAVALTVMQPERGEGFALFEAAVRDMQGMRCAHCGSSIIGM